MPPLSAEPASRFEGFDAGLRGGRFCGFCVGLDGWSLGGVAGVVLLARVFLCDVVACLLTFAF